MVDSNLVEVSYLIEGAQEHLSTSISNNSNGDDLRKLIFDEECRQLASRYRDLTILKINVDPASEGLYLPLLRFNDGDVGVAEISPTKKISEIWPDPPTDKYIHIFVKFTRLFDDAQERRVILNDAHLIYRGFWGKNINNLLQPVQNHPDVKYLATEHITPFNGRLVSIPNVLLVRKEYEVLYKDLWSYKVNRRKIPLIPGGVVVVGQPGIGKTYFSYYLLFRLLNERQPVALQVNTRYVLFHHSGVLLRGHMSEEDMPPDTWAISDSHDIFVSPCVAFLNARRLGTAWVIQTTSPLILNWHRWSKEHFARIYWMDVLSLDEMMALGTALGYNTEELKCMRKNYKLWGPSARTCINLMDETDVASHLEKVISTANSFTKLFDRAEEVNQAMASHQIFVVRPTDTSRQARTLEFASFHVLGFVSRAYANLDHLMRETFYKQISGHTWFGASVGRIFETSVLLWLRHAPQGTSLPCHPAKAEYPVLNIPVCRENIAFFSNVVDLGKVDQNETGLCLVLASQTFPSMDTIIITEESVITVQMTIAHTHDAKPSGFRDVYRSFTDEFRSKNRGQYYVFLTDTEDKAALLRNQTQVDQQLAKMGIQLYSAFIEFGKLDLIITSERVNGLETERDRVIEEVDTED